MMKHAAPPVTGGRELAGKIAVVTGSSTGIGKAIALELARAGAFVRLHGRQHQSGLQASVAECVALGGNADFRMGDLTTESGQDAFAEACLDELPPIDIWVNNAGADVLTGSAAGWSFEQKLAAVWAVDVLATLRLARRIGTEMQSREGVILNMGWDQAVTGQAGDSGQLFSAAKAAVMAFSLSLARTLAPRVRVNCLAPGWIKTKWGEGATEYWDLRARGESLLGRWGTPQDVAAVARFLVSPAGAFINGQIVPINGGCQPWPTSKVTAPPSAAKPNPSA